jgi:ubiquinone/menaquinone biosynthesis C-methylase UbiE
MRCDMPDLFGTREAKLPVEVAGWAISPAGIEEVLVTVDDHTPSRAATGLIQSEMIALLGEERAADCGFYLRLDPAGCPPGLHELTVIAKTGDGRALGVSGTVNCLAPVAAKTGAGEAYEPLPHADRALGPVGVRSPSPERYARYGWAARLTASARVLDAGCGTGHGTAILAEHARSAVGIDVSPPAIEDARRDHEKRAEFLEADMRRLPFSDGEFDAVVCFEAISHLAEPGLALDELRRVLARGGLLLVSSPNRGVYPPGNPLHLSEMTSEELKRSLSRRFANVAVYRQQDYHASLLCSEATLAHENPAVRVDAEVTKVAGGPSGSELYAVAVASDGALPGEPAHVALGEDVDYEEQRRLLEMWQERAIRAEAEVAEMRKQIHAVRRMQRKWESEAMRAGETG